MQQRIRNFTGVWQLSALSFFIADLQAGVGPFLGIFLLAKGWEPYLIGTVMTMGGVAGMLMTAPAGAFVDATTKKRMYVILPGIFTMIASFLILLSQDFWIISVSQIATAIAGSAIGPAIIGMTLGMVHQKGFIKQNGINQAYNHTGNMVGAALSGYLGMKFGLVAILGLAAVFGLCSILFVLLIPAHSINDRVARGLPEAQPGNEKIGGIGLLLRNKELLLLAVCLAFFHLGNGAMLPLYGMAAATKKAGDPLMFVAITVVIAQLVMIIASILAMKIARQNGYWLVLLISFIALPIRGFIAAHLIDQTGLYPVQILDGIGAGLQSVAVPGLIAKLLDGTGRINVGQGAIMTVQGMGAAFSPAIGGWMVHFTGYPVTFIILGNFSLVSILLWCINYPSLKQCCKPSFQ